VDPDFLIFSFKMCTLFGRQRIARVLGSPAEIKAAYAELLKDNVSISRSESHQYYPDGAALNVLGVHLLSILCP
jgi:hypothetical protein